MLQGTRFDRLWTKAATLIAGLSAGAMAVWWLSPRVGRATRAAASSGLDTMQGRLAGVPGCDQVCVRDLGGGIVEAFGAAPDGEAVSRVLAVLRGEPGVVYVVNRIWTPASASARSPDLTHPPRRQSQG
jgi:hypothetical protein